MISVIVPVYNIKNYVEKCVNSIINQTYQNFEIILVDDGSSDGSEVICDKLAMCDERIRTYHKANGGLSDARNFGIDKSRGKYISFVDGDDLLHPDAIELLLHNLTINKADISSGGVVREKQCPFETFVNCKRENRIRCFDRKAAIIEMYAATEYLYVMAWGKLYRRELFDDIKFPYGMLHEDMAIMYRLYEKAERIVGTTLPIYYNSQRDGSITRSEYSSFRMECWCKYYFEPIGYFKEHDRDVYKAVQAGYLKDAIWYYRLAYIADDKVIMERIYNMYEQCCHQEILKFYGIRKQIKYSLFKLSPRLFLFLFT